LQPVAAHLTAPAPGALIDGLGRAWRAARLIGSIGLISLLGACGSLPPRGEVAPSHAIASAADSTLGRLATQALGPAASDAAASGFRLLPLGSHALDARLALVASAERSLDAQYYHVHHDAAGLHFLRALRDAAARGVRVRLLVDDLQSGGLYGALQELAAHPGVHVRIFNPLPARHGQPLARMVKSFSELGRVNHRMHNKLLLADGHFALYGGRNIADEYYMRHDGANFIDLDVLSAGAVVPELAASFDEYWNSVHVWPLERVLRRGERREDRAALQAAFAQRVRSLPALQRPDSRDPLEQLTLSREIEARTLVLNPGRGVVHADSPTKVDEPVLLNQPTRAMRGKLDVIAGARSEVVIVSPYFIPGDVGMAMMQNAARGNVRGIVVTNSLGSTDEPVVHRAYSAFRPQMLALGMQIFELGPTLPQRSGRFGDFGRSISRLHAKAALVDRQYVLVGSVNMDGRSALLNTELGVVIDSPVLARQAMVLLAADDFGSMYRLRLANDGRGIEWHSHDTDGRPQVAREEPGDSAWARFKHWLQGLFLTEEEL
jgi:cardiolipin synthase C